jgi:hypothetical protein
MAAPCLQSAASAGSARGELVTTATLLFHPSSGTHPRLLAGRPNRAYGEVSARRDGGWNVWWMSSGCFKLSLCPLLTLAQEKSQRTLYREHLQNLMAHIQEFK